MAFQTHVDFRQSRMYHEPNEIDIRLLGTGVNLSPFLNTNSPSRIQMFSSHLKQMTVVQGSTKPRIFTGSEREYAKYTFRSEIQCNAKIINIIQKYPKGIGLLDFKQNPEYTIIYENLDENNRIEMCRIRSFHWNHKIFGFNYQYTHFLNRLKPGDIVPENTILAHSPSVTEEGDYKYGAEVQICAASFPCVIEDGIGVSKSLIKRLTAKGFGSRVVQWGVEYYPLNLYGDDKYYKPFPEIGDKIREDGIVFALRKYDPILCVCEMTPKALREIDYTFDLITYGEPGGIVEDIDIWHTHNTDLQKTPSGMEILCENYLKADQIYGQKILDTYQHIRRERQKDIRVSHELHRELVDIMKNDTSKLSKSLIRTFRKDKLDDWRVEVKFSFPLVPGIGSKLTDMAGGKGVIVEIFEDEDMPVDDFGNRAEFLTDAASIIHRMNPSRLIYMYVSASMRQLSNEIREQVADGQPQSYLNAFDRVMSFYKIASEPMHEICLTNLTTFEDKQAHIQDIVKEGIYLWTPPNTPRSGILIPVELEEAFPLKMSPITYRTKDGRVVRTKKDILISSLYIIRLEKDGEDWGAVATPKRQHHAIIGKLSEYDKYSKPYREQAIRIAGESEVRLLAATLAPEFLGIMLNFPNSPGMINDTVENILNADKPTNIDLVMDYQRHAQIESRALQYVKNGIMACSGVRFIYHDETPYTEMDIKEIPL